MAIKLLALHKAAELYLIFELQELGGECVRHAPGRSGLIRLPPHCRFSQRTAHYVSRDTDAQRRGAVPQTKDSARGGDRNGVGSTGTADINPAASRAANVLDRVGALVPWLGEQAARIEETRRIPDDVAERLFETARCC